MEILSVFDVQFKKYGKVIELPDAAKLMEAMRAVPMPERGVCYSPAIPELESCGAMHDLRNRVYGGMPIQIGMCWGYNTKLNCLEYHRDSEVNLGVSDFVLLLAKQEEITDGMLDTACVKAFRVPAGIAVEVYATTLHYAPCQTERAGFQVAVVLPKGTNTPKPEYTPRSAEDTWMTACNKWLLAHPESDEAKSGAHIGLAGKNIDIANEGGNQL